NLAQHVAEIGRLQEGVRHQHGNAIDQRQHHEDRIALHQPRAHACRSLRPRVHIRSRRGWLTRMAATTINPFMNICTKADTSIRFSTLETRVSASTPPTVRTTLPRPPASAVPPSTTATM